MTKPTVKFHNDEAPDAERRPMVELSQLVHHPDNPKEHDLPEIVRSIEANGFYGALIVQRGTSYVLAGNGRMDALLMLGCTHAPVEWVDVDEYTQRRILLADNRTGELGGVNDVALASLLGELAAKDTLAGTGYGQDDLKDLLSLLERAPSPTTTELDGAVDDMRENARKPSIVIETTKEVIEQFNEVAGETPHDRIVALLARKP